MKKVAIIGGGASGLMAGYAAAKNGHQVVLFEKNEKLGKKIYITGKGRCNFTNDVLPDDFLQNVVRGKKFLTGALYSFSPQKLMDFFEEYGMKVKVERGNRAFPVSDHASDVTKALERACKEEGVRIHLKEEVKKISTMSDIGIVPDVVQIQTCQSEYTFDEVIIATGGISYPTTGSTGDGYRFAKENGHTVTELKAGLCGLNVEGEWFKVLQGLTLKNVSLIAKKQGKTLFDEQGEMLFTHFGISGPLVLTLSSLINRIPLDKVKLYLDLKPALDEQTLDKRLLRDFEKHKNKQMANAMVEILPQKLIEVVLRHCGISPIKNVNVLTREERLALVRVLKGLPITVKSLRGFEEAIITSGGVEVSEINPKTMESKKIKGLRFCGEVLDVDAFTGGFNLQIAFSTGYVAGSSIK